MITYMFIVYDMIAFNARFFTQCRMRIKALNICTQKLVELIYISQEMFIVYVEHDMT